MILKNLSEISNDINYVISFPGVQEIKKFGFILLSLNSLQITSCMLLINTILPQQLY